MSDQQYREQVIAIAKKLYDRQMVNTNEGNVSIRSENRVFITPSQVCKEFLTPEMIAVTDLEGRQLEGKLKPSSEIIMHLHVYGLRDDVGGIVHNHSPFATAFAIAGKPIATKGYTEMIYLYDQIPVADYGAPGTAEIARGIGRYIHQTDVMLLANHGLLAVGKDVMEAYLKAESIEAIAKTLMLAHLLGGERPLPQADLDNLYSERKAKLGKDPIH